MLSGQSGWTTATTTNDAAASGSGQCDNLRGRIQVANGVRNVEAASSKHTMANQNASAGTKKVEDELLDDSCADDLYTPMPMDPRAKEKKMEAVKCLTDGVQLHLEEDRMTKDHVKVYKKFLTKVVENGWGEIADKYGFSSVTNISLFFDVHLGRKRGGDEKSLLQSLQSCIERCRREDGESPIELYLQA
jgi:hypothetical protein